MLCSGGSPDSAHHVLACLQNIASFTGPVRAALRVFANHKPCSLILSSFIYQQLSEARVLLVLFNKAHTGLCQAGPLALVTVIPNV